MTFELANAPELNSKIELFSAWVESQIAYKGQPGISIGLVHDKELFWKKGLGFADLENKVVATPQTIYRIASITKLFTATAVLQLRDAGKLRLDDPIKKYLDWFEVQAKTEDDAPVCVRHLITHTSGLPREAAAPYWTSAEFPSYEKVRELLPGQKKSLPTETRWKYSNLAVSLAGMIVAEVSGMPYEDYVEEFILKPLGMQNSFIRTIDPQNPLFAKGYGRRLPDNSRSLRPFGDCQGITPAANMATNVEDLAEFLKLQFRDAPAGGNQILKGSTLREMHTVHWLDPDWQSGWGWGFQVMRGSGKTLVGHGGSLMGFRTLLLFCPEDKFGMVILTNADDGNPLFYAEKAFQWILPEVVKITKKKDEKKEPTQDLQKYVGKYRSPWGDTQILLLNGELVAIDPSEADPVADMITLHPAGDEQFIIKMKSGFGAPEEMAHFEFDQEGKVARVYLGEDYYEPVANW